MRVAATLRRADADFIRLLRMVSEEDWGHATPCDDWDVRALVSHVCTGCHLAGRAMHGAQEEELRAGLTSELLDPADAFASAERLVREQDIAFAVSGAMERGGIHWIGRVLSGRELAELRLCDVLLHTWDLSQALGREVELDAEAVDEVLSMLWPLRDHLAETGLFGSTRIADVDAPPVDRLLMLTGRHS